MIVVQNHIPVNPEHLKEFESRFADTNNNLRSHKGFVRNQILRPLKSDSYIVMTYWENMEDFKAWTESEEFRMAHSRNVPEGMIAGKNTLTIHEVVQ